MTSRKNMSSNPILNEMHVGVQQMEIGEDASERRASLNERISQLRRRARLSHVASPPPPKTTMAAICMFVSGIIFLCCGLYIFYNRNKSKGGDQGISMMVLGGMMLIPGSYATCIIYGTYQGWNGYDYSQIPSYDEDN